MKHYVVFYSTASQQPAKLVLVTTFTMGVAVGQLIGGSIAHADPAAEWPALAMLYDAAIEVQSVRGTRIVAAKHFFTSVMSTALEPDELITAIDFPARPEPNGWGFEEFARRHGDFAVAGVAVMLGRREGRVVDSRIALFGVGSTPLRAPMAEAFLNDSTEFSDQVIDAVRAAVDPMNDLHASAEYRRHLVGVLAKRAIHSALRRVVPNL